MLPITFVLFDLDDTLLKSNLNYSLIKSELIKLIEIQSDLDGNESISHLMELIELKLPKKLNLANEILKAKESEANKIAEIIPHANTIPDMIKKFSLKSAILTNNSRESVNNYLKMEKFSYLSKFNNIFTRDDVPELKPNPQGINFVFEKLNVSKNKAIFVGDSHIDLEASSKAGLRFILFNSRNLDHSYFKYKPWKEISDLREIWDLINV